MTFYLVLKNCYERSKDKETDKPLEKVLIPKKCTRESTLNNSEPAYGSS